MKQRLTLLGIRTAFRTVGRVAPEQAALWAEEVFCRPPRARVRPKEQEFLATGKPFDLPISTGTLAAWEWGAGPAVLLVHGWGSRAARFRVLAPLLVEAGFRVVAYDGPAHGCSPGKRTSLPEYSAALLEVASLLGPLHAAVGHSLGGAAIAVALHRGLRLERAALIAPFGAPPEFIDRFAKIIALPRRAQDRMVANLERRLGLRFQDLHIAELARTLHTPAMVIHDRDDEDIPFKEGRAIATAWPGSEFVETKGLGHHAIMRDPEVARRVAEFVSGRNQTTTSGGPLRPGR
jgi:pimeloyl-ACP methyl ester carboxylesterase